MSDLAGDPTLTSETAPPPVDSRRLDETSPDSSARVDSTSDGETVDGVTRTSESSDPGTQELDLDALEIELEEIEARLARLDRDENT